MYRTNIRNKPMGIVINPTSIANAAMALLVGQTQSNDIMTRVELIEIILDHLTTAFGLTTQTTDGAREILQAHYDCCL